MKLKVQLTESEHKALSKIVTEFNEWPYRLNDIKLTTSQLEIDLDHVPVFWDQFLEHLPLLKREMQPAFIDAMREIPEKKIGVSFNKAMEVLTRT
jgi:hypothetical protein